MQRPQRFTAVVQIAGINPYVDVPLRVAAALGGAGKLPVLVKVAPAGRRRRDDSGIKRRLQPGAARLKAIARLAPGGWFRTTIIWSSSADPRLYLDQWMRAAAGLGVGDRAWIAIKSDRAPRALPVPAALETALNANLPARQAWEALAPSRRREILSYLNFLKTQAALDRNVEKVIATLLHTRA